MAVPSKSKALAKANYETLKAKRAWDLAISPAKQLPMQMVMVYFSGGGVQIFSMGMVAMLLSSPFKALASINEGTNHAMSRPPASIVDSFLYDSIRRICSRGIYKSPLIFYFVVAEVSIRVLQFVGGFGRRMEMPSNGSFTCRNR